MDWKELIGIAAPTLLKTLVPGGALITGGIEMLSEIVLNKKEASEQEVYEAIKANPELLELKIEEVKEKVAMRQADSKDLKTVNETMQTETNAEGWYKTGWRPFWGWLSGVLFFEVGTLLVVIAYKGTLGGNPELIKHIPTLITAFSTFFAIPMIVLGVQVYQRSKEKRARLGETILPRGVLKKLKELF
jgi:FtsZ-binding cell division protein ZapB